MVREIFLELGKNFSYENIIENKRDIFYLTKEEIFNYVRGTSVDIDLKTLIKNRKTEFNLFENNKPDDRFSTFGIVYKANNYQNKTLTSQTDEKGQTKLSGIGACAGTVRAKVKIVHIHVLERIGQSHTLYE